MSGPVPSFCSRAFLVRPPDEMGARDTIREHPRVEFTTRCWQWYWTKIWACSGRRCFWSAGLTQRSERDGLSGNRSGPVEINARALQRLSPCRLSMATAPAGQAVEENPPEASTAAGVGIGWAASQAGYRIGPASRAAVAQSVRLRRCRTRQSGALWPDTRMNDLRSLVAFAVFSLSNLPDQVRFEASAFHQMSRLIQQ